MKGQTDDLVAGLEHNWRSTFERLARSIEGAAVQPIDQASLVRTGLPVGFFNIAFVEPTPDPDRVVAEAARFFSGLPFTILVPEGDDDLAAACARADLSCVDVLPGMALAPIPDSVPETTVTIETVTPESLGIYVDIFSKSYGMPPEIADRCFFSDYVDMPDADHVIGSIDGESVAIATVVRSDGIAGVYNVGTLPEHRGKGYGAAVTWAVIQRSKEHGCHSAVLQSSEMGFSVYERMGFEVVRRYRCFSNDA